MSKQKAPKSSLNTILTISWTFLAFAMVYFSHEHHKQLVQSYNAIFNHKFKTMEDKLTAISILTFCSGVTMFVMMCFRFVLQVIFHLASGPLILAIQNYLKDSIKSLIITVGVFSFVLMHDNFGFQNYQLVLIMLWIFVARVTGTVGYLITAVTRFNFSEFAWVLQVGVNFIMLAQVMGVSILGYI